MRDKYGKLRSFKATFVVFTQNNKIFRARAIGKGRDFVSVKFPSDFDGEPDITGTCTVAFYANGVLISQHNFECEGN